MRYFFNLINLQFYNILNRYLKVSRAHKKHGNLMKFIWVEAFQACRSFGAYEIAFFNVAEEENAVAHSRQKNAI